MTLILAYHREDCFEMYADKYSSSGGGTEILDRECQKIFNLPGVIIGTLGSSDDMVKFLFNKKKLNPLEFKKILIKNLTENLIPLDILLLVFFKDIGEFWVYSADGEGEVGAFKYGDTYLAAGLGDSIASALKNCPPSEVFQKVNSIYPIVSETFTYTHYDKKTTKPRRKKAD